MYGFEVFFHCRCHSVRTKETIVHWYAQVTSHPCSPAPRANPTCTSGTKTKENILGEVEEPDGDNMEEIDTDNIVGSRTRGKNIDYAEAAKEFEGEDDDDEDDDDFEDDDDKMEE